MKFNSLLAVLLVGLMASVASAKILTNTAMDDGDGAVVCTALWDGKDGQTEDATINVDGIQYWWPSHVLGTVTTDTELDPIMWIRNTITNDMTVDPLIWTDYHIKISMGKTFNILAAATMSDWTPTITPVAYDTNEGKWIGYIDYVMNTGGTPIGDMMDGQFDYKISFLGGIQYCQEMVPTPEPTTLALLALGGLALIRRR